MFYYLAHKIHQKIKDVSKLIYKRSMHDLRNVF